MTTDTTDDYTTAAQLARVSKWLGAIPAFGDSIGTETSKAQIGCARRIVIGALEDFATMKDEISALRSERDAALAREAKLRAALISFEQGPPDGDDPADWFAQYAVNLSFARAALADTQEGGAG